MSQNAQSQMAQVDDAALPGDSDVGDELEVHTGEADDDAGDKLEVHSDEADDEIEVAAPQNAANTGAGPAESNGAAQEMIQSEHPLSSSTRFSRFPAPISPVRAVPRAC